MSTSESLPLGIAGLNEMLARVAGRFGRVEPRRQARLYVIGLLAPLERKNGWQLAEAAGDATPARMQRLLNGARWDPRLVREDLRGYVAEQLGEPGGVLIIGETNFFKKGTKSAGVRRQRCGTSARMENSQLGVFLAYCSPRGRALLDAELYLPRSWTRDRARCRAAGIPDEVVFQTRPQLARAMLARALDSNFPAAWVTANEPYGQDHKLRRFLENRQVGYVAAVPCTQLVGSGTGAGYRTDRLAAGAPPQAWKRMPARDGTNRPRLYDWAMATLERHPRGEASGRDGFQRRLLVRRSLTPASHGVPERAFYLCYGGPDVTINQLVRVVGARSAIEECLHRAKNETGLDDYQVRRYDGWHRHITLALLAGAYLAVTAPEARPAPPFSPPLRSVLSWHT